MAEPIPFRLGVRSNPARRGLEGNAVITNGYAENVGEEGKEQWVLYAHSGFEAFSSLTGADGGLKASLEMDGVGYVVAGTKLFSVTGGGAPTLRGTLAGASGLITMAANRKSPNRQIFIVSGNGLWWVYEDGVLSPAPDADLPAPNSVFELHGYAVFTHADGQFSVSTANSSSIDPLEIARAESNPDGLTRGMRRGADAVLAGPQSTEFWADVGDIDFPFSPLETIDTGIYAAGSMCDVSWAKEGEEVVATLAMAATNAKGQYIGIVLLRGYSTSKISTPAVDRVIAAEATPANIWADFRVQDGHAFYTISGTDWTWEYDFTTGAWNPRKSAGLDLWRVRTTMALAGQLIYGDYASGALYRASKDLFTENVDAITWIVQPPPLHAYPHQLQVDALHLDVIPASGLSYSAGNTIQVSYSQDGGASFSTPRSSIIGASGLPLTKITERAFGAMHETGVTFRFSMTAAVVNGLTGGAIMANKLVAAA